MKINIAVIGPEEGIGGTNRKYRIYFKYLDEKKFNKYYINISHEKEEEKETEKNEFLLSRDKIIDFLKRKNISYVYLSVRKDYSAELYDEIRKNMFILKNVNFTELYDSDEKVLNLIISKTDHLKIKLINGQLINDYVVYNPIDFELWNKLSKNKKNNYRNYFRKENKIIIGRLARAEPSKWEFLILKTLLKLQKEKNYDYGFVFAGTSSIYRWTMKLLLNKKMKENILFLPELKSHEDIAKFYNSIDLFWQTSHIGESFGNVIAEAFCFKVPVITDYKKFLQNDGSVEEKKYDAQIEVVDHGKNGAYCNYPETVIKFLKETDKKRLEKLGQNGYEKVKKYYDAKIAGNTLARILYDHMKISKKIKKDSSFEKLKRIPSEKEIKDYYGEYIQRLNTAVKNNKIEPSSLKKYNRQKAVWTLIENIYLVKRKLLRFAGIDVEKFNPKIK